MTPVLTLLLPGDPVPKARARIVAGGSYTPTQTREAEDVWRWHVKAAGWRVRGEVPFGLEADFRCRTRRRADLDNLLKLVLDAFNGCVWADDSQVVWLHATVVRGVSEPSTAVRVYLAEVTA